MVSLEGYSRAKEILLGKFGESTKITAAPFNVLPHCLLFNILGTMNKLKEITGYVSLTFDNFPGIRADLVR